MVRFVKNDVHGWIRYIEAILWEYFAKPITKKFLYTNKHNLYVHCVDAIAPFWLIRFVDTALQPDHNQRKPNNSSNMVEIASSLLRKHW